MGDIDVAGAVIGGTAGFVTFWILTSLRWREKISSDRLQGSLIVLSIVAIVIAVHSAYSALPRFASKEIRGLLEVFGFIGCMAFLAFGFLAAILSACIQIWRRLKR